MTEPTRRVGMIRMYLDLARAERRLSIAMVALVLAATILEGSALAALIPLLSTTPRVNFAGMHLEGSPLRHVALVAVLVLGLGAAVTKYFGERKALRFLGQTEQRLRREVTESYLAMNYTDFVSMRLGDINVATLVAANQIAIGAHFFLRALAAMAAAAALGALSFSAEPILSLVTVLFGAVVVAGYSFGSRRAQAHATTLVAHSQDIGVAVHDVFSNLKFFQSTGNVAATVEQTSHAYRAYAETWFQSQRYGPLMRMWFESSAVISIAAILGLAIASQGVVTPRTVAFLAIFSRAVPRVTTAQEWTNNARVHLPWYEAWQQRSAAALAGRRLPSVGASPAFASTLAASNISFRYPHADSLALDSVSWTLERGHFLAIVGASGSGKTTMLDVITSLLEPTGGALRIDGRALQELDRDEWQSRIGLVMQTNPMLHASVADNVRWTEPELDVDRLRECLDTADALTFVDALPDGIHTIIGEGGGKLSGGQLQRLCLARALYRDPWLLVLDEPTSALDPVSELAIGAALDRLRGKLSIVLSTHRFGLARNADRVVVLENGRVAECGSWDELVTQNGALRRLALDDSDD